MTKWSHCGSPNMYVRQLRYCMRSIVQYFMPRINAFSCDPIELTLSALVTYILLGTGEGEPSLVSLPPDLSHLLAVLFLNQLRFGSHQLSLQSASMPHSSPDSHTQSSGQADRGSGARHDITAETTSNVGYVSHRQAWAERKKKESGDKVSYVSSLHS